MTSLVTKLVFTALERKLRGTSDRNSLFSDLEVEESPRSLNGCDRLLLPQILRDFPDFDHNQAKSLVRDHLREQYGGKTGFTIHNVVIARYLPTNLRKAIVFQAAVSWVEGGKKKQKRFELDYTYILSTDTSIAANCPNCAGALGFGETECPYCGSRVANPLESAWKFTRLEET